MDDLKNRYRQVVADIEAAVCAANAPQHVRLLAVSKTHPAASIRTLYELGQRDFGENYVQEMVAKAAELSDLADLRWNFIGRIQSNKMAAIVRVAAAVQSLGSERHARLLAQAAKVHAPRLPLPVHILVNAGDESTKDGVGMADVLALAHVIERELPELALCGIMAIPPPLMDANQTNAPELYLQLRALADQVGAGDLSLGMSGDLRPAIAAGTTCVRIGTALFGPRRNS
jgi:PLP dependent protein